MSCLFWFSDGMDMGPSEIMDSTLTSYRVSYGQAGGGRVWLGVRPDKRH